MVLLTDCNLSQDQAKHALDMVDYVRLGDPVDRLLGLYGPGPRDFVAADTLGTAEEPGRGFPKASLRNPAGPEGAGGRFPRAPSGSPSRVAGQTLSPRGRFPPPPRAQGLPGQDYRGAGPPGRARSP